MTDVLIASTEADAASIDAMVEHHAQMSGAVRMVVEATLAAARGSDIAAVSLARDRLVAVARGTLLPHLREVEATLLPVAARASEGRLLAKALAEDLELVAELVEDVDGGEDAVDIAGAARALWTVANSLLTRLDELVLPLLVRAPDVRLADLVNTLGVDTAKVDGTDSAGGCGSGDSGGGCGCAEADAGSHPELDATSIPHAIRHATIFGALDAVAPGGAMVLVAPHDPLPLLAQLEERSSGGFSVEYLARGPEKWRLLLTRSA